MPRQKKAPPNRSDQRWEVKITTGKDINGKLTRKSFYSTVSKADAERQAEEWKIQSKAAELTGVSVQNESNVTFAEWAGKWLEKYKHGKVRENTYAETYKRTVENILVPYFRRASLRQIKPADIADFYTKMQEKYYESTLKKIRLCLNAIFETAIDNDYCVKNPAKNVTYTVKLVGESKHTYTQNEVEKIIAFAEDDKNGIGIQILLELGLRCSELLALKWSDFDFERLTVHIEHAIQTIDHRPLYGDVKSIKSNRILPISEKLKSSLERIKPIKDGYLFQTKGENFYTVTDYTKYRYDRFFSSLVTKHPEIVPLTPHELRHTCGTLMYARTKDIFAVSRFLGHSDINITTRIYVHDDVETLRYCLKSDDD